MADCIFCSIANHEIGTDLIYEDELIVAFNDLEPQAPVHFLVIPKQHIGSCGEIDENNSALVAKAFELISKLTKELGIDSFRVVSNCGADAGQSVPHLHFHVMAGREFGWPAG